MSWRDRQERRRLKKEERRRRKLGNRFGYTEVVEGREEMVNVPGMGIVPASCDPKRVTGFTEPSRATNGGSTGYQNWQGAPTYVGGYTYEKHKEHKGDPIKVGKHIVLAGAMRDLTATDLEKADIIVPLTQDIPYMAFGHAYRIVAAPLVDYGGVPDNWEPFLKEVMVPLIEEGHLMLAYCLGSHGRTGTFLASLIALMESKEETPDPIAAVRERHCKKCVESLKQATAIFALRGEALPEIYVTEFDRSFGVKTYGGYTDNRVTYGTDWWRYENTLDNRHDVRVRRYETYPATTVVDDKSKDDNKGVIVTDDYGDILFP